MSAHKHSSFAVKHSSAGIGASQSHGQFGFQNMPTLFQHVQNNLLCAGRHSYFIRIVVVMSYRNSAIVLGQEKMRDLIAEHLSGVNREVAVDKLTGLILIYEAHCVLMVEGSEDCAGKFMQRLNRLAGEYFKVARVVLVYNNANQVWSSQQQHSFRWLINVRIFFIRLQKLVSRIHYKLASTFGTPDEAIVPVTTVKESDKLTFDFLKDIHDLCSEINMEENKSGGKLTANFQIVGRQHAFVPSPEDIDRLLTIDLLQTLQEFSAMYGNVPDHFNYNDHVWPIPHDLIPRHVFDWNKYDVNLTFGERE